MNHNEHLATRVADIECIKCLGTSVEAFIHKDNTFDQLVALQSFETAWLNSLDGNNLGGK